MTVACQPGADAGAGAIVNVAAVPQRSPFRYPGGKTWLIPLVRRWLAARPTRPALLVEPFAGGGVVGLTAAAERLAARVLLVELDADVAAVWRTILAGDAADLVERIRTFELSAENVRAALARPPRSEAEAAFQTLLRNRVSHGGIMAPGAGLLKRGENGRGLRSRWYPATLARRIEAIVQDRQWLAFRQTDGLAMLAAYAEQPDAVFFIDPPYTAGAQGKRAGRRLYRHNDLDHERLFALAAALRGDFLMTYDDDAYVRRLAERHSFAVARVPMQNRHHQRLHELLIGRDLGWLA